LFAVIGTTYNTTGEGAGNFRLPNFVGIFPRGSEMGGTTTQAISGVTYTGGALNTKQADQTQGHVHFPLDPAAAPPGKFYQNLDYALQNFFTGPGYGNVSNGTYKSGPPIDDGVNGTPRTGLETRPANIAIAYIIKA